MDVKRYLEEGAKLENTFTNPTGYAALCDDLRDRLYRYRKALEAVLLEIERFENDWVWDSPVNLSQPPKGGLDSIRWGYALIRRKIKDELAGEAAQKAQSQ